MKISIFTTITKPEERMDPWKEQIFMKILQMKLLLQGRLADEFSFDIIGKQFQGFQ